MLWRSIGSPAPTNNTAADVSQVSEYARNAMLWAVESGIITGLGDGRLEPQGQATRAQVAYILMSLLNNVDLNLAQ